MEHAVNVTFSIVNNKTEDCMVKLHSSRMSCCVNASEEQDNAFWNYLLDDLDTTRYDENNKYIYAMFNKDAAISFRISIALLENILFKTPNRPACELKEPVIFWDIPFDTFLISGSDEFELQLEKFRNYVDIFIGDYELGSLPRQIGSKNLPGCLLSPETRSKVHTITGSSVASNPSVKYSMYIPGYNEPVVMVAQLENVKGYKTYFDKKYVKEQLKDFLHLNYGHISIKPSRIEVNISLYGLKSSEFIFETSVDGIADITAEHIKVLINKVYGDYNGDDEEFTWARSALDKMMG